MTQKMNFYGVGPKIMIPTVTYGAVAVLLTILYPSFFRMCFLPDAIFHIFGGILIGIWLTLIIIAGPAMKRAVSSGKLETTGFFAAVRNPIYSAWIIFFFPGLAFTTQGWLLFGMPVMAYYRFTKLIPQEEAVLEKKFGEEFIHYKRTVPALTPCFKRRSK